MIIQIIILIAGFILLIKGADIFVDGASSIAENCKLSKMLIGLTIVAFGTSAPEFAVSVQSQLSNSGEILIGNVIGSNIINILLIAGVSALIFPINIKNATVKKEIPILLLVSSLLVVIMTDNIFNGQVTNQITRSDGIIIILFFLVFIYYLIATMRKKIDTEEQIPKYSLMKSIIFTILGILGIIVGSNMVVNSATKIAELLNVSERIISLTIIALGTSLPELVTSLVAAKKREPDIIVGNVIGSNIFNICIVLGVPVAIFGGVQATGFSIIDIIAFLLSALLIFIFAKSEYKITKKEGIILLIVFVIYYSYIITQGAM